MKKLNVLLSAFACEPNKGSEEGVGWNWAVNLAKTNNVFVIVRGKEKEIIESYLKKNPIDNLHFFYYEDNGIWNFVDRKIPFGFRSYYKHWQKKIIPIVKKIIKEYKIDIVHNLTYNEYRTPGKMYKLDIPFVWGPLGGGHEYKKEFKKAFYRKSDVVLEIIRKIINHCYANFDPNINKAIKVAKCVLIADPETYKIMPKIREYVRLLETAYYPDRNSIKEFIEKSNRTTISLMYAGVLTPRKGLKLLIEALGESDFRDFKLIIIGEGKDKVLLEQSTKKYDIEKQVEFLGQVSYEEVNSHYDNADLFVFPSIRDTSGNVVLEAMSHGVPVITLNHNGASEMVTPETGELIDINSYDQIKHDFIDVIKRYYNDRSLLKTKGKLARKRIEEVYSWNHVMKVINEIYRQIVLGSMNN